MEMMTVSYLRRRQGGTDKSRVGSMDNSWDLERKCVFLEGVRAIIDVRFGCDIRLRRFE